MYRINRVKKQWVHSLYLEIQFAGKTDNRIEEKSAKNIGNMRQ